MPDLWMPGAERHDIGDHAPCDASYPPKAIAHITWDKNATASSPADHISFESLVNYFTGSGAASAPHVIWDPFTGQIAQLVPADSRSKSVVDSAGGTRTNRAGRVVIQIEAVFFPYTRWNGKVYARLVDTPCRGWPELHAWVRSWGVPDTWPMGRPVDFTSHRDEATWESRGGWYAHAHVPENDHQDPGSWPQFTTTSEEDDMALTDDDLRRIALAVNGYHGKLADGSTDPRDTFAYIRGTDATASAIKGTLAGVATAVGALETTGLTDAQVAAIADKIGTNTALVTAIADAVAANIAGRLES